MSDFLQLALTAILAAAAGVFGGIEWKRSEIVRIEMELTTKIADVKTSVAVAEERAEHFQRALERLQDGKATP